MGIFLELHSFDVPKNLYINKNIRPHTSPDFPTMIEELKNLHDMTAEKIAFILPVANASTVSEWGKGVKPNFENGEAFIELWMCLTGKTELDIPRGNHGFTNC